MSQTNCSPYFVYLSARRKLLFCISIFLVTSFLPIRAEVYDPKAPRKLRLDMIYLFDEPKTEFILVIGQSGFKTVDSLKKYLETVPKGSTLEWSPGCCRIGGEPLSDETTLSNLRDFCKTHGIEFIVHPSG